MSVRSTLRIFVSAGDVSGDMHAGLLIETLKKTFQDRDLGLEILALGGERTQASGARLIAQNPRLSSTGLAEPLLQAIPGLALLLRLRHVLKTSPPDLVVLIDYPGINIPLASILKRMLNVPIIYYLPPDDWHWAGKAKWNISKTRTIAKSVDLILAAHEKDAEYYQKNACRVRLIGHPMQDIVVRSRISREKARSELSISGSSPVVGLFPASRSQELKLVWPIIAASAARMLSVRPEIQFLLPVASDYLQKKLEAAVRRSCLHFPELEAALRIVNYAGNARLAATTVIAAADLALTKSGSVTLELALRDVPQVVLYEISRSTEWIGRNVLGLSEHALADVFLALPNILAETQIVPEFRPRGLDVDRIAATALELLDTNSMLRFRTLAGYRAIRERLGEAGAVERAAEIILNCAIQRDGFVSFTANVEVDPRRAWQSTP